MNARRGWIPFRANAARSLADPELRATLRTVAETFTQKRADALSSLPFEEWRDEASALRLQVLDSLSDYLDRFAASARRAGATIHRAQDASSACEIVASLLKEHGVRRVVKSKSMVCEEIHLNEHLQEQGMEAVETDLGEYINQLAGHGPSHIIVPAIHNNKRQIGKLFARKLGAHYTEDAAALTRIARNVLRQEFLSAQAGITGANFATADTGSLALLTNEGNGRLVTTLPPLHIAVLSIDKMIPSLADLPLFIRLLPRSATGQILTSYLSVITGTRKAPDSTGAQELHIVLVDNGRSRILAGPYREMLKCIRCGACLNACPIYRLVGGHAYGATYPGPMGIVFTTLLNGMERAHPLLDATTLCGACAEVCPVKVPLVQLLRRLREERVERGLTPQVERMGMAGFAWAARSPFLFHLGQTAGRIFWPIVRKIGGNTVLGRMPDFASRSFRRRVS
ncbi:MAG: LutB/LldF family L-lactate oxidation iron-sulfur protein [candidate division NC10 bacterium]|nr:LutB/LldF family L-lactate oxidation iron-sulfur protein [candidate division NC10 bacterium]